jgi:hypothetical protein
MIVPFGQNGTQIQFTNAAHELASCNPVIGRHGLALSSQDIQALIVGRLEALQSTERVEFGTGVAKEIVLAFASSPYVSQATFVETVLELQEQFYEFKNESLEQIADDELIAKMRSLFDEVASGDLGYLEEALFEGLARHVREETLGCSAFKDAADPAADNAAANAATLAQHRFNVSDWVDDTYSPGWEGSSWLDE